MNKNRTELTPVYADVKSFYGKAIVETEGEVRKLFSYGIHVATVTNTTHEILNKSSVTTRRHIKEFFIQNNVKSELTGGN